jgi:hypothetical protein
MSTITEDSNVKASLHRIFSAVAIVIAITIGATLAWASQIARVDRLAERVSSTENTVNSLAAQISAVQMQQAGQTEILKYLANDRRGPLPEAAK